MCIAGSQRTTAYLLFKHYGCCNRETGATFPFIPMGLGDRTLWDCSSGLTLTGWFTLNGNWEMLLCQQTICRWIRYLWSFNIPWLLRTRLLLRTHHLQLRTHQLQLDQLRGLQVCKKCVLYWFMTLYNLVIGTCLQKANWSGLQYLILRVNVQGWQMEKT